MYSGLLWFRGFYLEVATIGSRVSPNQKFSVHWAVGLIPYTVFRFPGSCDVYFALIFVRFFPLKNSLSVVIWPNESLFLTNYERLLGHWSTHAPRTWPNTLMRLFETPRPLGMRRVIICRSCVPNINERLTCGNAIETPAQRFGFGPTSRWKRLANYSRWKRPGR